MKLSELFATGGAIEIAERHCLEMENWGPNLILTQGKF